MRLVLVACDEARGEATLACLRAVAPGAAHRVHYADLARIAEMKRVATEIATAEPRRQGAVHDLFGEGRARTLVYLATSPDVAGVTGGYFTRCTLKTRARPRGMRRRRGGCGTRRRGSQKWAKAYQIDRLHVMACPGHAAPPAV
jgi:hypothetical protein